MAFQDTYAEAFRALDVLLVLARSSRRDSPAIDKAEHHARAVLSALKRDAETIEQAKFRETREAIRSDALARTIATERNEAYKRIEQLEAELKAAKEPR